MLLGGFCNYRATVPTPSLIVAAPDKASSAKWPDRNVKQYIRLCLTGFYKPTVGGESKHGWHFSCYWAAFASRGLKSSPQSMCVA